MEMLEVHGTSQNKLESNWPQKGKRRHMQRSTKSKCAALLGAEA